MGDGQTGSDFERSLYIYYPLEQLFSQGFFIFMTSMQLRSIKVKVWPYLNVFVIEIKVSYF